MTTANLHKVAEDSTPSSVDIPKTYTGLIVWAVGKWGIGVVFAAFLVPVYQDLKASNQRVAEITSANVQVLTGLAAKIDAGNEKIQRLDDAVRRIELGRQP